MKVSIIGGAGTIGSTAAFVMAQRQSADEICLVDVKENVAKSHEMDMGQAVCVFSNTKITSGPLERIEGSNIIVLAVGLTGKPVSSRMEHLEGNLNIMKDISPMLRKYGANAVMITATNPVDLINSMLYRLTGIDSTRLLGFSINDSFRFRWAIAKVLDVDFQSVQAFVSGEHGELQVPVYSQIFVNGVKTDLSNIQKEAVSNMVQNWFAEYQSLQSGRTSGWLSGVTIAHMVEAIAVGTGETLP